jgi:glycosyltransferase involved in cell wall biosynthesis
MVLGATTDVRKRPVNRWTTCEVGSRQFQYYPIVELARPGRQQRFPISLRFTLALARCNAHKGADILEFHGIEPSLAFLNDSRPKTVIIHTDMRAISNSGSDIRWRHFPSIYFGLERLLLPKFKSVYCVRQSSVDNYRSRFPLSAEKFHYTATWVDPDIFGSPSPAGRREAVQRLRADFGLSNSDQILITVGRLASAKNPELLIEAFKKALDSNPKLNLIMIGDGQLRSKIERTIDNEKLSHKIFLCGMKSPDVVAQYLRGADVFVLSSVYEGMPMSVLEALACGLPVVTTDVGEVRRVVRQGYNGEIVSNHDSSTLAAGIIRCLEKIDTYKGKPCTQAVKDYVPEKILQPIYANYRRLAKES